MNKTEKINLVDRYGKNFTIRFTTEERDKLDQYSKMHRMKPTSFIRDALNFFYEKLEGDEEIKKIESTDYLKLALLINEINTPYGRARLQHRLVEGK